MVLSTVYVGGPSGGLEPCRCSRPARDAAPTIAPTIFCSDRLAADAGPGRRRSRLPQNPGPMPSMRPISWGSARNRRDRTGREAVEMAGVVLGYRASWHDRGPGERHDSGGRSRGRGPPRGNDPPNRPRPEMGSNLNPSYIISAFRSVSTLSYSVVAFHRPLPSGVSGGRRGRVIARPLGGGSSTTP